MLWMTSCGPKLEFNLSQEMTPDQMLARSSHVFVGVIERQQLDIWPYFRVPAAEFGDWKVLRRRVYVEGVFKGQEPRKHVEVLEIFWNGDGVTGDWNLTRESGRYLFLVRVEDGHYHVVRDWWRSIFEVHSGRQDHLPLNDDHPLWERIALMMWHVKPGYSRSFGGGWHSDPGGALSQWRYFKIRRGLLRHPDRSIRLSACESLLHSGVAQDECWDSFDEADRSRLNRFHNVVRPEDAWRRNRDFEQRAERYWAESLSRLRRARDEFPERERDSLRLMTTIRDEKLRRRFCGLYQQNFPADTDHGCPDGQARPATIVTDDGDIPLQGAWPQSGAN
jgi:hypothetical protein